MKKLNIRCILQEKDFQISSRMSEEKKVEIIMHTINSFKKYHSHIMTNNDNFVVINRINITEMKEYIEIFRRYDSKMTPNSTFCCIHYKNLDDIDYELLNEYFNLNNDVCIAHIRGEYPHFYKRVECDCERSFRNNQECIKLSRANIEHRNLMIGDLTTQTRYFIQNSQ